MASIGPELPPHLAKKRKRESPRESDGGSDYIRPSVKIETGFSHDDDRLGHVYGPTLLPEHSSHSTSSPSKLNQNNSSDEEEDYGPIPQGHISDDVTHEADGMNKVGGSHVETVSVTLNDAKPSRDEWMMVPPKQDDLAARMDPTRARPRQFNTGRSANNKGHSTGADTAVWTETPEQKRRRLHNEQLGISEGSVEHEQVTDSRKQRAVRDDEKARKIKEHNDKYRSTSLLSQHETTGKAEKEDDPNHRSFDYEKDMTAKATLGQVKKRELFKQANQFTSRFSGGTYL